MKAKDTRWYPPLKKRGAVKVQRAISEQPLAIVINMEQWKLAKGKKQA